MRKPMQNTWRTGSVLGSNTMKGKRLAFIDLETTGTDPWIHEILEIGCVLCEGEAPYKIIEELELKVQPKHIETASIEALRINGYDESAWLFAVTLKEAMEHLSRVCDGAIMIGHNVAFDWGFIANALGTEGVPDPFFYAKLDTKSFALGIIGTRSDRSSLSLTELADVLNLKNERAHTALADARICYEAYKILMEKSLRMRGL
jgi:DNA polymerase III epsilon subunit-like protein